MPASQATFCRMQEMKTPSGCAPPYIQSGILKSLENPSFLSRDAFPSSMVPEKDTNPWTPSGLRQWTCHPAEQERRGGFVLELPCLVAFLTRTTQHPLRATSPSDSRGQRFPQQTHPGPGCFLGLGHYVVQGALSQLEPGVWGMAWSFAPAGPGSLYGWRLQCDAKGAIWQCLHLIISKESMLLRQSVLS